MQSYLANDERRNFATWVPNLLEMTPNLVLELPNLMSNFTTGLPHTLMIILKDNDFILKKIVCVRMECLL